jgi:Zn-dependent peptidase ImmA (M78 family)/DNA-binding XRE family transcriptional regulator
MVDVPVNKDVLVWARKERGLSEQEAAKRLKLPAEELAKLESGSKQPSLALLDRIAQKYKIPFASLLMPEPLPTSARPADFRTFEGKEPIWDDNLLLAIEEVNAQIEMFLELREHDPDLFKGNSPRGYSTDRNATEVADEERKLLGVSLDVQFGWPSGAQAFRYWRHVIERAGIFVQIKNLGPENLCRGLAVFDDRGIPAIIINGDETEGPARTFTLLHEYAHILIRQPGVSDQSRKNGIERWCNQFAAYFLMPEANFKADAIATDPGRTWSDSSIRKLAEQYKVSMSAVALHLEDVGLAKPGLYEQKIAEWEKRKRRRGGQIMSYPERQVHRLGVRHVGIVMDAMTRHDINSLEAFELMDVDPKHFDDLKKEVAERQRVYGGVR